MDVNKILDELRLERDQLDEAILSLERLAVGSKRRGRPPLWIQEAQQRSDAGTESAPAPGAAAPKKRKRRKHKAPAAAKAEAAE